MLTRVQSGGRSGLPRRRSSLSTANTEGVENDISVEENPYGLTCLHDIDGTPDAAIIFVHGLGGGSRKTWCFKGDPSYYWPSLWLPDTEGLTNSRIMTYGYDSRTFKWTPTMAGIKDFAFGLLTEVLLDCEKHTSQEYPIIFVAHSMGGLVVKEAINKAHEPGSPFAVLQKRFAGAIFMGTPHRGAENAAVLQRIVRAVVPGPPAPFLRELTPHSSLLQQINDNFRSSGKNLSLVSFYETLRTQIGLFNYVIVDEQSTRLDMPKELRCPMPGNHSGVCQYENTMSPGYQLFAKTLAYVITHLGEPIDPRSAQKEILTAAPLSPGPLPRLEEPNMMLSIPFPRNPRYVGNGDVIQSLTDMWKQQRGGGNRQVPVAFLRGLGGIGKTQTATEFAYSVSREASIIWMRASSAQTLQSEFTTLAKALGCEDNDPETVQRFIKHWLRTTDMIPWLLVLDNADDLSFIGPYLPTYGDGMVVITTRDSSAGVGNNLSCAIQPLQEKDALSLLLADARPSRESVPPQQQEEAKSIVELMGYLPLAIEQAASYIRERQCSLTHYKSLLTQRFLRRKLVSRAPNVLHAYPQSLNSTVCAALEAIREKSASASNLLRLMAFMDAQDIDLTLLRDGIVMDDQYKSTLGFFFDDFDFDEALALLLSYSIITRKNDGQSLWMHVLVQDIIVDTAEDEEYWNILRSGARFLFKLTPESAEEESWPRLVAVWKHVQKLEEVFKPVMPKLWSALDKQRSDIEEDAQRFCQVFWRLGYFLRNRAEEDSISLMGIAQEIRSHTTGELDPEFIAMKRHVGSILVNQQSRDSIRILGECVTAGKQILEQREAAGDTKGAIEALLDLGKSRVRYAIALSDLGGDLRTSLQVCENQVREEEQLLPKEHPQAIITRLMLAYYLFMIDEFEKAVVELDWAHSYYQSSLGDQDSLTFRTASNLACVLAILGRQEEADKHFQTALHNAEIVSQGHYFYEARINYNIGVHLYSQGKLAEADNYFNHTLDLEKNIFSGANDDHMEQHTTREMQALVHLAQGRYDSACQLLERALEHSIRVGTKDRRKIRMMNNLALAYDAAGRPADAARMLERREKFKDTPEGTPGHFQDGVFVNYLFHYILGKGFE